MKSVLSENIRSLRKERNLTQEQLAEAVGVTVGAVSKWESGLSNPDISLLPELAEFFHCSIDFLLGYQLQSKRMQEVIEGLRDFKNNKQYDEGLFFTEKALRTYPNNFDVVYQCALLYHLSGIERNNTEHTRQAIELYQRSLELISQNTDSSISEVSIQCEIGALHFKIGETEKALKLLKRCNVKGINNSLLGIIYATQQDYEQSISFLSDSLTETISSIINLVVGFTNAYNISHQYQEALELLLWAHNVIQGLKKEGRISYLDKLDVALLSGCAQASATLEAWEEARRYLFEAKQLAERFDADPNYSSFSIKYYQGKLNIFGDNFGETALEGLVQSLHNGESNEADLLRLWEELQD